MTSIIQAVQALPPGKAWAAKVPGQYHLWLAHPVADRYHLEAAWVVPETYDEDPLSIACGCSLYGRSHVHAERDYPTAEAAVADYQAARDDLAARKVVRFASSHRVGA